MLPIWAQTWGLSKILKEGKEHYKLQIIKLWLHLLRIFLICTIVTARHYFRPWKEVRTLSLQARVNVWAIWISANTIWMSITKLKNIVNCHQSTYCEWLEFLPWIPKGIHSFWFLSGDEKFITIQHRIWFLQKQVALLLFRTLLHAPYARVHCRQ